MAVRPPDFDAQNEGDFQNLFDKYYFQSVSDVSAGQLGVVTGVPGLPRTFSLSIERKF